MTIYPWKRFWCPRDGTYSLADAGFLYDPDSDYGNRVNPQLAPLTAFADFPCLVMLGEPGIGKSTEFESEVRRQEKESAVGTQTIRVDLKEFQTDGRLVVDVFANSTVREWVDGDHILNLFVDSLDEGRLEIRNIAGILAGQLRQIASHAARLRLRVACRTAEWPASLEQALTEIWGERASIIELTPLRRRDVRAAAEANGIDAESFLAEVLQKEVQPFATNPITLKFLLGLYARSSELPSTKRSIYEAGCLKLCDESSQSRRDSGHFGNLSAAQRLEVASRIAAFTVFSGRSTIDTSGNPAPNTDAITVADLAGGFEMIRDDRFDISEADVRETLSTTLFAGRGPERLGFAHWTYAEFLAAQYVAHRAMDANQLSSLIFHPEHETKVIPQLAETAAWMAVSDKNICDRMMSGDPQALLRSDVATADDGTKEALVRRLVEGFQADELDDSDWSLRDYYRKLAHSKLTNHLESLLLDKTQNRITRRFVADVAEECRETGMIDALKTVALDEADDPHVRSQASNAIVGIGDDTAIASLKPLALGQGGDDPDDELRGIALRGLWRRRLITAEELFATLIRPQQESFLGSYRAFLHRDLANHLAPNDLATALHWCSQQERDRGGLDDYHDAMAEIVRKSLIHVEIPNVVDALAEYVVSRITRHEELLIAGDDYGAISHVDRRRIVAAVVARIDDPKDHAWGLVAGQPALCVADDLLWLLEQSETAERIDDRRRWADLARIQFLHGDRSQLDHVLACCEVNPVVNDAFADLFQAIELRSLESEKLRAVYERDQELEKRGRERHEPPPLDPPPEQLVEACLARIEQGDLNAWWALNRELQLEPNSTHYRHDLNDDLTDLAGWKAANADARDRILRAAKWYLTEWQSHPENWLGTRTFDFRDFSGYRALVLVDKLDPSFLASLNAERWANVAPCILGFPMSSGSGDDGERRQQRLIALAYQHALDAVIAALTRLIDEENADEKSEHLFVLRRVEQCWDNRLIDSLSEKAASAKLKASCVGDLLTELISRGSAEAIRVAKELIEARSDEFTNSLAKHAAVALWVNTCDRGWDVLWPNFQADRAFFRDVISDVAHVCRQSRHPPAELAEEQLADLYILLAQEFPQAEDAKEGRAHFVGPRESVQHYRDNVLSTLRDGGTSGACAAIERIRQAFPHLGFLAWTLRAARRAMLQATWIPLPLDQIRELTARPASRLVRSGRELQKVILESIARLQNRLHGESPAVRDLWDKVEKGKWRPVDENAFSDYLKRHLEIDLNGCGIVSLREVEIRRGNNAKGERTDIYVTATVRGPTPGVFDCVRAIVEVKGCWNGELQSAMETQLKDRYLKNNDCECGIYVVGWFGCDAWDDGDTRKRKVPSWELADARAFFEGKSQCLSDEARLVISVVVDASLR